MITPLSLTLLSDAFAAERRGLALGIWSGVSGLGVALGPVVGGAVVDGFSWQWIFWLNVPIGIALIPAALAMLSESRGPNRALDLPGVALASSGLLGVDVRDRPLAGAGLDEHDGGRLDRAPDWPCWRRSSSGSCARRTPMLPMRFFQNRAFAATNGVSLAMFFGAFGSIFLLAQFFQVAQGYSPLEAGIRTLPWTAMPIFVAPVAGVLSDRIGSRPLMAAGLALQSAALAYLALVTEPDVAYAALDAGLRHGRRAGWRSCSRRRRTRCWAPCGRARPARRRARPTRSARSAASSAWPCWPRCSRATAATARRRTTWTGSSGGVGRLRGAGGRRAGGAAGAGQAACPGRGPAAGR